MNWQLDQQKKKWKIQKHTKLNMEFRLSAQSQVSMEEMDDRMDSQSAILKK